MFLGIYGVLLGTIAALAYRSIDFILYANRTILKRGAGRNLMYYAVNGLAAVALIWVFSRISFDIGSYLDFAVAGVILSVAAMVVFVAVNAAVFRKEFLFVWKYACNRMKRKR